MIDILRDLLARAERGEITALAMATQGPGSSTGSAFELGMNGDTAHLVCALERLKLRLLAL